MVSQKHCSALISFKEAALRFEADRPETVLGEGDAIYFLPIFDYLPTINPPSKLLLKSNFTSCWKLLKSNVWFTHCQSCKTNYCCFLNLFLFFLKGDYEHTGSLILWLTLRLDWCSRCFPLKCYFSQWHAWKRPDCMGLVKAITLRRLMNGIRKPICGCLTQWQMRKSQENVASLERWSQLDLRLVLQLPLFNT